MSTRTSPVIILLFVAVSQVGCNGAPEPAPIVAEKPDCACRVDSAPGYNAVFFANKPALIYDVPGTYYMESSGCTNVALCDGNQLADNGMFQLEVSAGGWSEVGTITRYWKAYGQRIAVTSTTLPTTREDEVNRLVDRCWHLCESGNDQCGPIPSNASSFSQFAQVMKEIKEAQKKSKATVSGNDYVKIEASRIMEIFGVPENVCLREDLYVNAHGFRNEGGKRCGVPLAGKVNDEQGPEPFVSGYLVYEKSMKARLVPGDHVDARFETAGIRPYLRLNPPYGESSNGDVLGMRHRIVSGREKIDFLTSRGHCFTTHARQ